MEENLTLKSFLSQYKALMELEERDPGQYSPLVLAYIGDAVYEVIIRAKVINRGSMQVNKMHRHSSMLVKASAQAKLIRSIQEDLTQEERSIYRRGRNAKSATMARHATMTDYRTATGLEALAGWLFLKEEYLRLIELISLGLKKSGLLSDLKEPAASKEGDTQG